MLTWSAIWSNVNWFLIYSCICFLFFPTVSTKYPQYKRVQHPMVLDFSESFEHFVHCRHRAYPPCGRAGLSNPGPIEKSDRKSCRTFLAGALGLEFQVSGIYGVFETFVFLKHHFHPIYSIIFNCSFCVFPLKGNRKGKNMGNKQVLTTPQYTRVWASHLINRDAHKKGGRRILCNFTEIRSYQA